MSRYPFTFEAELDRFGVGRERKVWYNVLFLPPGLEQELPFAAFPRLRVEGEIADIPVEGAWMPTGDGRRYFIVAPRVLKESGAGLGTMLEMRFAIADQDAVDVPEELQQALAASPAAKALWEVMTAGKKRAFTHRIGSARTAATRIRRVAEAIDILSAGRDSLRPPRPPKEGQ